MRLRKTQQLGFVFILFACLLVAGCKERDSANLQGAPIRKEFTEGPLQVQLELDTDQILLSELLPVEITIQVRSEYEVTHPDLSELLKDFRIESWKDLGKKLVSENKVQTARQYRLEPLRA